MPGELAAGECSERLTFLRNEAYAMRIMIAHSFYRLLGGENRYVEQQAGLLSESHEIDLLAVDNSSISTSVRTATQMVWSRSKMEEVETRIDAFDPDVIHVHNTYPSLGSAVHLIADRKSIPLVMTVHNLRLRCPNGLMFTEGGRCERCLDGNYLNGVIHSCFPRKDQALAYAAALWIHRFVLQLEGRIDFFIAPSDFMAEKLITWGIPSSKIGVIRNFATSESSPNSSESSPNNQVSDSPVGMFAGRISSEKGLHVLIEALGLAGDPRFLILGDGPLKGELMARARDLGLRRTDFLGERPLHEVKNLFQTSAFAVFPSLCDENAPLAVLESMMAGCAVIVSDRGGLPELVDGRGFVVPAGDAPSLAVHIRELARSPSIANQAGEKARRFALNELSAARHVKQLEQVYRSLIDG